MSGINLILENGHLYLFLLLYLWLFVVLESSQKFSYYKKFSFLLSSFILFLVIGCRWETGTDWNSYLLLFQEIKIDLSFLLMANSFDVGYLFFNAIIRVFTDNYVLFLLINSGITIFLLSKLLNKISPYPNLSLFFFYTNFMISHFMGSNRRMMSLVFVLWMFYFIYQNKKKWYTIYWGLAFAFHRSALVNIVSIFVSRKIFSLQRTIFFLILALLIGVFQLPIKMMEYAGKLLSTIINNPIVDKMLVYSDTEDAAMTYSTGSLLLSTTLAVIKRSILLSFYIYVLKKSKVDPMTCFFYNLYVIGFIGYLCFIGSFFQILTTYFALIEIVLVARIYSYTSGRLKTVFCLVLGLYGFLQLVNALSIYPDLYIPYTSFWTFIN